MVETEKIIPTSMLPKYPFYIVSKSRWDSRLTAKALCRLGIPYYIIVEESQYPEYAKVIKGGEILILPQFYLDQYDTCDDLGATKSKGPGAARNFAWDHSISLGAKRHWVLDDNCRDFQRLQNNRRIRVGDGTQFKCMEDFVDRYKNVAQAGPTYVMFAPERSKLPPYILNTRIYSMLLIKNDIPYRWRGRYNEDTDLSLRILKDGLCTVQFYAFLGEKIGTQIVNGGNTEEFYGKEGTSPKSEMLKKLHPDVTEIVWKFGRVHHHVDYRPFERNKLIPIDGLQKVEGNNEYGMRLHRVTGVNLSDERPIIDQLKNPSLAINQQHHEGTDHQAGDSPATSQGQVEGAQPIIEGGPGIPVVPPRPEGLQGVPEEPPKEPCVEVPADPVAPGVIETIKVGQKIDIYGNIVEGKSGGQPDRRTVEPANQPVTPPIHNPFIDKAPWE